jgi:hypothetical protein
LEPEAKLEYFSSTVLLPQFGHFTSDVSDALRTSLSNS